MSLFAKYFRCRFCRDQQLKPVSMRPRGYLRMLLGFRLYRCPHCFDLYWRPVGVIRALLCPLDPFFNGRTSKPVDTLQAPVSSDSEDTPATMQHRRVVGA